MPEIVELPLEPATSENVAPFGTLIRVDDRQEPLPIPFFEGTVATYPPPPFVSDADTVVSISRLNRRPFEMRWMERHFKHTQTFIPLCGRPFIMILAPPTDTELPNLRAAAALKFAGDGALMLHIGTWHEFPLPLEDATDMIVILRNETTESLLAENVKGNEGHGPDLDKKDIVARLDTVVRVVPAWMPSDPTSATGPVS